MIKTGVFLIFLAMVFAGCSGGTAINDYLERAVTVGGKEFKYRVLLPPNRDPNAKLPVMLYLHGSGSRGHENREQAWAFQVSTEPVKDRINFIVVLPQCDDYTFWSSNEMSSYALAALDQSVAEFNGDPERLYLAGFSLGAYGVWHLAAANPGKFAALMPVAGGVIGANPPEPRDREALVPALLPLVDSPDPYKAFATAIGKTPVWVFHGAKDDAVPVDFARRIVKSLDEAGNKNVKYTEYPEDGHLIFAKSFSEPGFLEWLADQRLAQQASQTVR